MHATAENEEHERHGWLRYTSFMALGAEVSTDNGSEAEITPDSMRIGLVVHRSFDRRRS